MDVDANNLGANVAIKQDAEAEKVQDQFRRFLEEYVDIEKKNKPYLEDVKELQGPERNTLPVKFSHLEDFNGDLAQLVIQNYYRLYPYLCRAVKHLAVDQKVEIGNKELYISFENVPTRHRVRELTAEKVGALIRISGQVVRTHPVHPELSKGYFICEECNTPVRNVLQQFKYTQPTKCGNPACQNRMKFQLDVHKSQFVDFQKVRIQETQAELPRGSIPRSVEVILRGEAVEVAQPGDRCDFTGSLIVVPDVSQISTPGTRAESSSRHRGQEGTGDEGLRGLKSLGVRDLNYKLAFLACSVTATNPRFGGKDYITEEADVSKLWAKLTNEEKKKVKKMGADKNLTGNLINSLFPAVYGKELREDF